MMIRAIQTRRSGVAGVIFLIGIPILLLVVGLVLYVGLLRDVRTETQNGADAAALAAAWKLATDDMLTNSVPRAQNRVAQARAAAIALAHANFAAGDRIDLDENLTLDIDGDIVLGNLDQPLKGTFTPIDADSTKWIGNSINAVRIKARRNPVNAPFGGASPDREVIAVSIAMLDFSVIGFRPNDDLAIPLMPIAVLTDHIGALPNGWDARLKVGSDDWAFDPLTKKFTHHVSDGIPEVTVVIGPRSPEDSLDPKAVILQIGANSLAQTVQQISNGIARTDFGGDFVLGPDNILNLPGSPDCPAVGSDARRMIDQALWSVREKGEPRIWQLYSGIGSDGTTVQVTGWMAARIVSAHPTRAGGIKLVLQPAVVCQTSAVTEQRETPPAFWANNRTICRVRLAD